MKLSIILLAIAFAQGTYAETIPELLTEFTSIINNRIAEVGQLLGYSGKDIGNTYGVIQNNIGKATQNLTEKIRNIGEIVNASIAKAADLGKNIDACVSEVESGVSSLDLDILKTCRMSQELVRAQKLLSDLGRLPRQLGILIPKCIAGFQKEVSSTRICLSEGLQTVDDIIDNVNSNVKTLIDGALEAVDKCINGVSSDVNNSISFIADGLDECVTDILN